MAAILTRPRCAESQGQKSQGQSFTFDTWVKLPQPKEGEVAGTVLLEQASHGGEVVRGQERE